MTTPPRLEVRTATVAILIALAMLMAPLCGSLCASAKNCPLSGAPGSEPGDCHHQTASDNSAGPQMHNTSAKTCSASELPAAALNPSKSPYERLQSRISTSPLLSVAAVERFPSLIRTSQPRWRDGSSLSETNDQATDTTVLRI
jgi:hypothetical protein